MGFAFRIMIFVIGFNLAVGAFIAVFGAADWNNDITNTGNDATYGVDQTNLMYDNFNKSTGVPVEEASFWYRFLDVISIGIWTKMKAFLDATIFAIPAMIQRMSPNAGVLIPTLKAIISIIFVIGMFELFTGKAIENR